MKLRSISKLLRSTTLRLSASYLLIIMVLCIAFSGVIYQVSSHQLGRRVPPPSLYDDSSRGSTHQPEYDHFFDQRISESRSALLSGLVLLNLSALLFGSALSYFLARRTLNPIEKAMDAQSRFVTDASHELRTPLTSILTTNEVALRKPKLSLSQAKDVIESNTEDVKRLKDLTDGLLSLTFDSQASLTIEGVSLQDVVNDAINQVIGLAKERNVSIEDDVQNSLVKVDKHYLSQALVILLDNAIKYSREKSTVHIDSSVKNKRVFISVKDEGKGIEQADLPHIFDRFYRADISRNKTDTKGYGLGLSIANKIIDQHHGKISVDSTPDKGSTFTIELSMD